MIKSIRFIVLMAVPLVLFNCGQSPTAKLQSDINDLLQEKFDHTGIVASETELPGKWSKIESEVTYDCFGDQCQKTVYGLVNQETGDTLRPAFDGITVFGDKLLLMRSDWTAMTNMDLQVERAINRVTVANDSLMLLWDGVHMGAINNQLTEVVPMQYDSIVAEEIGFLLEPDYVLKVEQNGKWGILSSSLQPSISPRYETIHMLMGYVYAAKLDGKFGIIKADGKEVTPFKYDSLYSGGLNHAIFVDKKKIGLVTLEGQELTQAAFESLTNPSLYGCRCARRDGKYGVISSAGEELSGFVYDEYRAYASVHDEMQLRKNGKWGFFDCKTKKEVTPFIYDDVTAFYGYEANVLINGKSSTVKIGN